VCALTPYPTSGLLCPSSPTLSGVDADFLDGVSERYGRLPALFDATGRLAELINAFLDQHEELMEFRRDDATRDLGLIVVASFGKALKTFQAIGRLAVFGYGEDALVLVRTNVNLLINLNYVLSAPDPTERVKDFIAYSYTERVHLVKDAYGETLQWKPDGMSDEEIKERTVQWKKVGIAERARGAPPLHYLRGYKLYSSFEHSDALALDTYATIHEDGFILIEAGERDEHVGMALLHSWSVMAEVLVSVGRYLRVEIPDTKREFEETWPRLHP
jgi:uncharacterized protein DUF5677